MLNKRRVLQLVSVTQAQDEIGQIVNVETLTDVIARIDSVSLSEITEAAQIGLQAEFRAVIWADEYSGEEYVLIDSSRYHVYRTYDTGRFVELYLEKALGHD